MDQHPGRLSGWRRRRLTAGVLIAASIGIIAVPGSASAAASAGAGPGDVGAHVTASPARAGGTRSDDGSTAAPLPMRTRVLANGVKIREAEPAALKALISARRDPGCGRECEGKNPAEYVWKGPGGPSNWYPCGNDAVTAREAYWPGGGPLAVELRYSPRCRTAWARASKFYYLEAHSYYLNGKYRTYVFDYRNPYESYTRYTVMLDDAGLLADACIYYEAPWWDDICTSKY
jgi:hypothetical protein